MTPASDVYSFAILMYELYTCKHLFKGMMHSQARASTSAFLLCVGCGYQFACVWQALFQALACSCTCLASTVCASRSCAFLWQGFPTDWIPSNPTT